MAISCGDGPTFAPVVTVKMVTERYISSSGIAADIDRAELALRFQPMTTASPIDLGGLGGAIGTGRPVRNNAASADSSATVVWQRAGLPTTTMSYAPPRMATISEASSIATSQEADGSSAGSASSR